MSGNRHIHSKRNNVGGRPASERLQAESWGSGISSPNIRLAEAPRRQREESTEDRRIRSLVQKRLAAFGSLVEDEVTVSVHNGRVLLSGIVGSDYARQAIVHEVERIAFVKHVRCSLTVGDEPDEQEEASREVPLVRPQLVVALAALSVAAVTWWVWTWMRL